MATVISKSWAAFGIFSLLVACGGEDPGSANAGGNPATVGSAGAAGASGGSSAGTGGAAGGAGAGGMGGGAAGAMPGGSAGAGGSAGQGMGGAGGAAGGGMGGMAGMGGMMVLPFELTTKAFEHVDACQQDNRDPCKFFPKLNVMDTIGGQNQSPELDWGPGPAGTMSYAITLHDYGNGFTHWAIWNIPAATLQLPADLARNSPLQMPAGAQQKSFNKNDAGYMGPGAFDHVYEFRLYALKVATFTPQDASDQGKIYDELTADKAKIVLGTSNVRGRSPLN